MAALHSSRFGAWIYVSKLCAHQRLVSIVRHAIIMALSPPPATPSPGLSCEALKPRKPVLIGAIAGIWMCPVILIRWLNCVLFGMQYTAVPKQSGAPLRTVTVKDAIGDLPPLSNGAAIEDMDYAGTHLIHTAWATFLLH